MFAIQRYKYVENYSLITLKGKKFRIIDGLNFYFQYKDIFLKRIYQFDSDIGTPLIIDGGSNIGTSIVYFKSIYPNSRIIGFEPDPDVFKILAWNIEKIPTNNITLINSGLGNENGEANFSSDGNVGGFITNDPNNKFLVKIVKLSEYFDSKIDFLKLNIEGLEYNVLKEVEEAGKIHLIKKLVIEYHGLKNNQQLLGKILDILERNNFHYLIHDFDSETCSTTKPPIHFSKESNWFCLIYGFNNDYKSNYGK